MSVDPNIFPNIYCMLLIAYYSSHFSWQRAGKQHDFETIYGLIYHDDGKTVWFVANERTLWKARGLWCCSWNICRTTTAENVQLVDPIFEETWFLRASAYRKYKKFAKTKISIFYFSSKNGPD